jgi:hypothetical protein
MPRALSLTIGMPQPSTCCAQDVVATVPDVVGVAKADTATARAHDVTADAAAVAALMAQGNAFCCAHGAVLRANSAMVAYAQDVAALLPKPVPLSALVQPLSCLGSRCCCRPCPYCLGL